MELEEEEIWNETLLNTGMYACMNVNACFMHEFCFLKDLESSLICKHLTTMRTGKKIRHIITSTSHFFQKNSIEYKILKKRVQ